jgi:NhaA family Na+:H+ antiporter
MIPAIGVSLALRRGRVTNFWPYAIGAGGLSWLGLYFGGVHPALALVPIVPFMPHAKRDLGLFDERERHLPDTMNRFEHWWKVPVQLILFFFGLVNAGVTFGSAGTATWMVLVALLVGKPLGIVTFTVASVKAGLRAPGGLTVLHTVVVGVTAAIGFTVALFFATAAFPGGGQVLDEAKTGALLSFVAAPLAILLGRAVGLRPNSRQ